MREFEKWAKTPTGYTERESDYAEGKAAWRAALKWYQSVAETCEKDCETPKDYKILYFHLKQVLKNEVL